MQLLKYLLIIALFFSGKLQAQDTTPVDTLRIKSEQEKYLRQQDVLQKFLDTRQNDKDKFESKTEEFANNSISALPVLWDERGPESGYNQGLNQIIIDANDSSGKKAWLATWSGLWYNNNIIADSSWHRFDLDVRVYSIAQNPVNPLELALSTYDELYLSTDGGITWNNGFGHLAYNLFYNFQGDLFSACFDCSTTEAVYKFNRNTSSFDLFLDASSTFWQETSVEITDIDFDFENLIYLSLQNGKIYRSSTATGGSWQNIMNGSLSPTSRRTTTAIGKDLNNNKIIYSINLKDSDINNTNWFRKSEDGGINWNNLSVPLTNGVHVTSYSTVVNLTLAKDDPEKIVISGTHFGSSENGGQDWNVAAYAYASNNNFTLDGNRAFLVINESSLKQIDNVFGIENFVFSNIENGLLTANVYDLELTNNFNDSLYFGNRGSLIGHELLRPQGREFAGSQSFIDKNENDLRFLSGNSDLIYIDKNGNASKYFSKGFNSYGAVSYDEKENVLFGYRFSSEINNQTVFYKIHGIGDGKENVNLLLANKYFNVDGIVPINDSSFIINHRLSTIYKSEFYLATINLDNTITFTQLNNPSFYLQDLRKARENSNLLFTRDGTNGDIHFSNDQGLSWINKTTSFPFYIYSYALNESNLNQVFAVTLDKVFTTSNFLSETPTWVDITGNLKFPHLPIYNVWYRESDGQLIVNKYYSGLFSTSYFESTVPNSIIYANYPTDLCVNEAIKVTFYSNGAFSESNNYELWLSDANGDFSNATKIGDSEASPIYGEIPNSALASTNYRIRVLSTNTSVPIIHADSEPIQISKGASIFNDGFPKIINETENGFVIGNSLIQNAEIWYVVIPQGNQPPSLEEFKAGIDSTGNPYIIADSIMAIANESSPIIITGLLSGTEFDVYVATKLSDETCFSSFIKLSSSTRGIPVSYCTPISTNGCAGDNYISQVFVIEYTNYRQTNLSPFNSGCSPNSYSFSKQQIPTIVTGINNQRLQFKIHDFQGSFFPRGVAAWIDLNNDGDFQDDDENLHNLTNDTNDNYSRLYAPVSTPPGLKRIRIRVIDGEEYTNPMSPCNTYLSGETEDFLVNVETNEPYIFANLDKESVGQCEVIKVVMEVTGSYNSGNLFQVELSDSTGNFADSTVLLSGLSATLPVNIQVPNSVPSGENYKLRVVSTNPVAVTYESAGFSIKPNKKDVLTDYTSGAVQVSQIGTISGKNNIQGTARIDYKAWNSVILSPAFEASPSAGGAFKAEIVGCGN